jgi:acyl-CoA thioesterase
MTAEPPADRDFENLTGLEYLRKMVTQWQGSPMAQAMRIRLIAVDDGQATFEAFPTAQFYNPQRRMHGGYLATLIDSALGCAVQSKLDRGVGYGTIELKVNYTGKVTEETGRLLCTAHVIHAGRTMLTAEARVVDGRGKIVAHGSGTFLVYPK